MAEESEGERTLEVLGLPEAIDEEFLLLYFENRRRSAGGPLLSVTRNGDRALLVFEEAEVAARVLSKRPHVLQNVELIVRKPASKDPCRLLLRGLNANICADMVELFVDNLLGSDVEDYTLHRSPGKDLVLIQLNQPLSQDLKVLSASVSKRPLDGSKVTIEQVEQTDSISVDNLHPGTTTDMLTLYFENQLGGNQTVKEVTMLSEGTAKVSFVEFEAIPRALSCPHRLQNADLVLKPYFDFLHHVTAVGVDNAGVSSVDMDDVSCKDTGLLASPPIVDSQSSQSKPLCTAESMELTKDSDALVKDKEQKHTLSYHVAVAGSNKLALFQLSTLEELQSAHPDLNIVVQDDGVHITGTDKVLIEQLQQAIVDFFASMATAQFAVDPRKAQFLGRTDVTEMLLKTLQQNGLEAVYSVLDSSVFLTCVSQDMLQQASDVLHSQMYDMSIPVEKKFQCTLYCREWTEFLQTLRFTSVEVSEDGTNIYVLTLAGLEIDKHAEIVRFLSSPIQRETVIPIEPGMLKYIQSYHHQLLAEMQEVSIFPLENGVTCGLKVQGNAAACQSAEEVLQGVVSSICTKTIIKKAPGVARFLVGEECTDFIAEMERRFQVNIVLKSVHWEAFHSQDIFDAALKIMAQKNFRKLSVDTDSVANECGSPDGGLLEAGRRDVSVVVEPMGNDASSDMADVDLYTSGSSGLDSDPGSAAASHSGSNQLPGLSPYSLDEEAQISLAIQYSMESNNRSLADYELELKRALELSSKLTDGATPSETLTLTSLQEAVQAACTIQIEVFANYPCDLSRVDIALGKRINQRQVEEKLEHCGLKGMSKFHEVCVEAIKRKYGVEIQLQGTKVVLSGFRDYVEEARTDLKQLLKNISICTSSREILRTVQWERHDPASSAAMLYSPDLLVFLENAWRMEEKKVDLLLDNQRHIIDFEKMQECNTVSGKSVRISRNYVNDSSLTEDIRGEDLSLLSNLPESYPLDEASDEFQAVVKSFCQTMQEFHSNIKILKVDKLVNRLLYNQYKLKKASITQRAACLEVERTLYHGTSEESVKEIRIHGFNRSFCGKNATVYGQGVYFAVQSRLSLRDLYSPPNAHGHKFVLVSKVLTGDYTTGFEKMKAAPLKGGTGIPLRYDSVTDNISKPSLFVIFNDTQAYPEYLITCQKIRGQKR